MQPAAADGEYMDIATAMGAGLEPEPSGGHYVEVDELGLDLDGDSGGLDI